MWLLLIILTFLLVFTQVLKAWAKRKDAEIKLLLEKWETAREERIAWKERYQWLGFDHPEYQKLWEIEIGAEDLYLLYIRGISLGISWSDWRFERRKAEQDRDDK